MEKTHDSLGRKLRDQPQLDKSITVSIRPGDIEWFSFIHRHGGRLPTSYIHESTANKSYQYTQRRLTQLTRAGYFVRPYQQFETVHPERNELIYELTEKAEDLLKERGLYSDKAPSMRGAFKHQVFDSCISASIELNARQAGYGYTPHHEILVRSQGSLAIEIDDDRIKPDGICGLVIDGCVFRAT